MVLGLRIDMDRWIGGKEVGLPSTMVRWQGLSERMSTESFRRGPRTC